MGLFGFGKRPSTEASTNQRRRVEGWIRAAGAFDESVVVKVNEIVCADPACPGTETILLVMRPGQRTQALKIAKALADVERNDIDAALSSKG